MWSEKTLELRDRYSMLFGMSQMSYVAGIVWAVGLEFLPKGGLAWLWFAASALTSFLWRRSWRKYRAATLGELAATRAQGALYAAIWRAAREEREE